ncbi:tannase/feruloyl esterase family alpha/beta hydrolase [Paraburkholderia sp. SEWSISQ10-3 4]|nr:MULTISPECIES: tannase/feruloyl esterase family alpha/beta hydrolase [Paraburkholderia]MBK3840206.1 tannase/feruloyl esterase family alpha/beta hydrolase [Paraburkholderia aspalathi]MCX4137684.1 tannase/feruloyl esterase family alpha/beta hydrolase [Paraburkholderia aspalathi]MDN7170375.1 tannase/feruloyl esterase family alpha/beta hydrolase [Paraburkholderia sp. SEWSISQ10-3 4]MDQ6500014.1 tannase/feruloyl esterase family alpha/beta hydrolase [Paraburkholderia aspalathi]CAE6778570.1 Mono(2-h
MQMKHTVRKLGGIGSSLVVVSVLTVLSLNGCGNNSIAPPAATPLSCAQLAGKTVPASSIGLPTTGATVTAATTMPASGTGAQATGEYCLVSGAINPVDPAAPQIKFQIAMPTVWNNKIMMFGGGGYDGTIPAPTGNVPAGPTAQPTPLGRGYATFASDSGHQANALGSEDGSFGVNDEAVQNFSGDALKKTRDAAVYLIDARYAVKAPKRAYFAGGSSGGREALAVVQRWPQDWDGSIVLYPAWAAASLDLQFGRITRALAAPGAYLDQAKRKVLLNAVLAACDTLDGVADGLISNVAACNTTFNPATATVNGTALRCAGGADTGDTCLSDAQISALNVYNTPITFGYPLASGETQYPGFNVYGADLGVANASALQPTVTTLALGTSQPASPMPTTAPYLSVFWDQWIRYFVTRDSNYNSLTVDPQNPGSLQARISQLTGLQDVNKTDLSAFNARGGKILMAHGMADALVSTRSTEQYYQRLQATMGASAVANFVRFYEIPGYGHAVSTVYNASWDSLTTLENWVENGVTPPAQTVADTAGVPGRTRPLCEYPSFPRYNGSGDVNAASSFTCATQ